METDVHDFWCVNKVTLFLVVSGYITECLQSCNKYNKRSKDDSIHRDFYIWYESAQADILCKQVLTLKFNASTSFLIPKAVYFYQLLSQILELEYYEFRFYFILFRFQIILIKFTSKMFPSNSISGRILSKVFIVF